MTAIEARSLGRRLQNLWSPTGSLLGPPAGERTWAAAGRFARLAGKDGHPRWLGCKPSGVLLVLGVLGSIPSASGQATALQSPRSKAALTQGLEL